MEVVLLINKISAKEAPKHLLFLTNLDIVFLVALGLYILHIDAIVSLNSKCEPKYFLPFLQ